MKHEFLNSKIIKKIQTNKPSNWQRFLQWLRLKKAEEPLFYYQIGVTLINPINIYVGTFVINKYDWRIIDKKQDNKYYVLQSLFPLKEIMMFDTSFVILSTAFSE